MKHSSVSSLPIIIMSFFVALALSILPLPDLLLIFWPQWLPLLLIYWIINAPQRISVGIAWILGLLLDSLYGSLLGQHALALSITAYFTYRFHRQLRMLPSTQQAIRLFFLILIYQLILLWIQGMIGQLSQIRWFWVSIVSSTLCWPWLVILMQALRKPTIFFD